MRTCRFNLQTNIYSQVNRNLITHPLSKLQHHIIILLRTIVAIYMTDKKKEQNVSETK
jgi:hypothetical protein